MRNLTRCSWLIPAIGIALLGASCSRHARSARHLEKANTELAAGRFEQAEIEYKNVIQLDGFNPTAVARLGTIYREDGRVGQALPFLSKAKELRPTDPAVRLQLGLALLASGNLREAREEALFVLAQQPTDDEVPLLLAEASTSAKDIADARQRLTHLPGSLSSHPAVLIALGQLALHEQHVADAEALFERARQADPKSPNALAALGMVAWSKKETAAADAALKQAAELSPIRSPRRLQYIQFKIQTGDAQTGKRLLDEITRAAPDYLPAWIWRAEVATTEKDFATAEAMLAQAAARDSVHPEVMLLAGRVQLAKGDAKKAAAELEKMVTVYPNSAVALYQLGLAYAALSDMAKAADAFNRAVALDSKLTPAVLALAETNIRRGDVGAAIAALKLATQQHPDLVPARVLLAQAYQARGQLDEALAIYRQLEQQFPNNAQTELMIGAVLKQQNQRKAARDAFTRAHELSADNFAAVEQLVDLDLGDKDYRSARQRAEAAAARSPKAVEPHLLIAQSYLAQNDFTQAEPELQRAIALQPDSASAYFLLARLYVASNQRAKAIANLGQLLAKNPKNAEALTMIAVLEDVQKNYPAARDAYERLLTADPKSVIALNNLAYLYSEHFDNLNRAYELAQRARALQPQESRTADTLGWVLYRKGQYAAAVVVLQESAAKLTDEPEAQFHFGMASYMTGDELAARAALERAAAAGTGTLFHAEAAQRLAILSIDPAAITSAQRAALIKAEANHAADPIALSRLAGCYEHEGNLGKARSAAQAALQINPKNAPAAAQLARIYAAQGDRAEAIELAKAARAADPTDAAITHLLGSLVYESADYRWAASLLREAAERLPEDPDALFDWAQAAYSIGQVTDAETATQRALQCRAPFRRASDARRFLDLISLASPSAPTGGPQVDHLLKEDPSNVPALMAKGTLSERRGDLTSAQQCYEKVLERFPEFAPAQRALALIYASQMDDMAKAARVAAKAREAFPGDADVAKAYGIIVYRQGDYSRAALLLQESASVRTTDAEALYYLGMAQLQIKRKQESRSSLRRALELGLNEELAAQAKKNLAATN